MKGDIMPATVKYKGCRYVWAAGDILLDLFEQGGLSDVDVQQSKFNPNVGSGRLGTTGFYYAYCHGSFLIVSMKTNLPTLVVAFSTILELKPFCSYVQGGDITVEWAYTDPDYRWAELQVGYPDSPITNLVRL
jgi:hypothetical protein